MSVNELNVTMWKEKIWVHALDWLAARYRWARQDSDLRPSDYESLGVYLSNLAIVPKDGYFRK